MPPPYPKRRQPTQSHRTRHRGRRADRQGRHPRRDTGTARATDAAGAGTGSDGEPESAGGDAGQIRQAGRRWDRPRPADRQSHAEPPRMPQRVQLPPQTQTGRRERQRAADDTIYKAREGDTEAAEAAQISPLKIAQNSPLIFWHFAILQLAP